MTDVLRSEDGQAQERRLITQVLHHVEAEQLWLAERNFCTLGLLCGRAQRGAVFVVRQHGPLPGERLGRPTRQGATRSGPVDAQPLLVRDPASGETRRGRRLTLTLTEPPRDGDTALHIRANVPGRRAAAAPLARLDGKRWTIETAWWAITTTLSGESTTLGSPHAAFFPLWLALVADTAVSLITAALRSAHGRQQGNDAVSSSSLA